MGIIMISQILDEAYLNEEDIPVIKWGGRPEYFSMRKLVNILEHEPFMIDIVFPPLLYNGVIETDDALLEVFASHIVELENYLLKECFEYDTYRGFSLSPVQFQALSLDKKCEFLGITEYLRDRNLKDLSNYVVTILTMI